MHIINQAVEDPIESHGAIVSAGIVWTTQGEENDASENPAINELPDPTAADHTERTIFPAAKLRGIITINNVNNPIILRVHIHDCSLKNREKIALSFHRICPN